MVKDRLEILCDNVRILRKKHGYSKKRMAEICGVSIKTINKMEQGIFPPRLMIDAVGKLAFHFGIEMEALFCPMEE